MLQPVADLVDKTIELSGLSPTEFKILVESVKDFNYDGDSYHQWLASKLVERSTELGTDQTQLLAQWERFMIDISNHYSTDESDLSDAITAWLDNSCPSSYTKASFGNFKSYVEDRGGVVYGGDWKKGIDLDDSNAPFVSGGGEEFEEAVYAGPMALFLNLNSNEKTSSDSDIKANAKLVGLSITNEAQELLYRLVNLISAHEGLDIRLVLKSRTEFWSDPANEEIVSSFLSWFTPIGGVYCSPREFSSSAFREGLSLVTIFDSSVAEFTDQVKIVCGGLSNGDEPTGPDLVFMSRGHYELDHLEGYRGKDLSLYLDSNREIGASKKPLGFPDALAYYTVNGVSTVETLPCSGSTNYAVTKDNIAQMAVMYAMREATCDMFNYAPGLPEILTGRLGYKSLVANCLPLLLYGSNVRDHGVVRMQGEVIRVKNPFAFGQEIVEELKKEYYPYMDFEARHFFDFCYELEESEGTDLKKYLSECGDDDPEAEEDYIKSRNSLLSHLASEYTKFLGTL